jgi:hypothetical protein
MPQSSVSSFTSLQAKTMKLKSILSVLAASTLLLAQPSCSYFDKAHTITTAETSTQTADQILIRSEQLTKQALYSFDTFLFIERNNEQALKDLNPNIHVVAEKIRVHGQEWLKAARRTTKAFKDNRTAENAANLQTAYLTLKQAYDEVQSARQQADTLSHQTP